MAVGLVVGSGYQFWVTRRSEIISALLAISTLGEELRLLLRASITTPTEPDSARAGSAQLAAAWEKQRAALVPVMHLADIDALWQALPLPGSSAAQDLGDIVGWVDGITRVLWEDLQSVIFTSFVRRRFSGRGSLVSQISDQQHPQTRVTDSGERQAPSRPRAGGHG